MKQTLFGMSLVALLTACSGSGGNPVSGGDDGFADVGSDSDEAADTSEGSVFATGELLVLNAAEFDEDDDQLALNNLPFDGPDGRYDRIDGVSFGGSEAGLYASRTTGTTGQRQYYAIFQRNDAENLQTVAVATNDYIDSGFGGVAAQRLDDDVSIPGSGEYIYRGTYAGTRVNRGTGADSIRLVTGDALIEIDIDDFDVTGAVEGAITNRRVFTLDGTEVATNLQRIQLTTSTIDSDNGRINSGTATGFVFDGAGDPQPDQTGTFEGVFAGDDGEEVGGIIVLNGTTGDVTTVETGGFLATRE